MLPLRGRARNQHIYVGLKHLKQASPDHKGVALVPVRKGKKVKPKAAIIFWCDG